jgi:hypothetical protein
VISSAKLTTLLGAALFAALATPAAAQQLQVQPSFSIWDVKLGQPIAELPDEDTGLIACGTNGGPPSQELRSFTEFATCPPEASGLHEVYFSYDDEQDYIAMALNVEYAVAQGGTSVFAHPVIVSVLVDGGGIVRGIRIVTDDRVSDRTRRTAVTLARNFKARFGTWNLACEDIPPRPGENPVGRQFEHQFCRAEGEGGTQLAIESYYLRKRGQEALNRETRQVNSGYFSSGARMELVESPYVPALAP